MNAKRFRFTLKELLVAIALVAIACIIFIERKHIGYAVLPLAVVVLVAVCAVFGASVYFRR